MNEQLDLLGDEQPSYPTATVFEESEEERQESPSSGAGPSSKAARIVHLAQQAPLLTDAEAGELDILLERHLNTASTPQLRKFLYDPPPTGCGFQKRWIKEGAKNTTRLSTSIDALLANYRLKQDKRLELCLRLSDLLTQTETLNCRLDKDGRIRFALNIAGTKVGRMSCYASNSGSGYNLTTVSDRHKRLFLPDEGHDFWQVDLKGADSWSVAAECAALGDPTMLDDLRADLKPAKILVLLYEHGAAVNKLSRPELAERCKAVKKDWKYSAAKKATHGSCYGEGEVRMAETILEDSWKEGGKLESVTAADCRKLQSLFFARYPGVRRWQERVRMLLERDGKLTAASGLTRDFFGPKKDHATQKEGYAFCPAANTAWANNLALLKLWSDPNNRDGQERIAKLLLPVHDSVTFQAPQERRDWVAAKIPIWWANPITVAGITFTIDYEAQFGPSWGELHAL